jgi:hypothetical protein
MFTCVPYVQIIIMLCFYKVCILRLVTKNYNFILVTRNSFREDFFRIHHVVILIENSKWFHLEQFQISSKIEGGWGSFFEIYIKNKPLFTFAWAFSPSCLLFFVCVNHYLELKLWYPRDKTHLVSKGQSVGFNYLKQGIMQKYEKQRALKLRLWTWDFVLFYA